LYNKSGNSFRPFHLTHFQIEHTFLHFS
jgi:hypothetical protein